MFGLAPRPGFRPKARTPPNAPSGARDDEEPRQTEFDLQGQLLRCHAPSRVLAGSTLTGQKTRRTMGTCRPLPSPRSRARSTSSWTRSSKRFATSPSTRATASRSTSSRNERPLPRGPQGHCGPARRGRAVVAGVRRRAPRVWADVVRARPTSPEGVRGIRTCLRAS